MRLRIFEQCTLALVLITGPVSAQTKENRTAPVEVKRVPPPKPLRKEPLPTPDKYPFGQLIQTLGPDPMAAAGEVGNRVTNPPALTVSALLLMCLPTSACPKTFLCRQLHNRP